MPYQCVKCGGETANPKTIRKGWRGKGTIRKIVCLDSLDKECKAKFKTVEVPLADMEATIRKLAGEMFRAMHGDDVPVPAVDAQKPAVDARRVAPPRLPVHHKPQKRRRRDA
jgi:hypothetical protein